MIKVMVVDDDKLVRKGLISAMPWQNFDMEVVGEASNGEKALEFLESNTVDLLLTDLAMPVMSGIELIKRVRKEFTHIYIVVLTLHQDFEYIQEALRLGAIDYIAKVQLEKERFEEVLERIYNRIAQEQKRATNLNEIYTSDRGYALLSLNNDVGDYWVEEWCENANQFMIEVDINLWLWTQPVEQSSELWLERLTQEVSTKSGWALINLIGLYGRPHKDVHRRLREYREKDFFYDYDLHSSLGSILLQEWDCLRQVQSEESINHLREQWSSYEWIYQDSLFKHHIDALKMMRLPQAKLFGLLYALIDRWNLLFYPVSLVKIQLLDSFDFWYQVDEWCINTRNMIRNAMDKPTFSQEVMESIVKAVYIAHEEMNQQITAVNIAKRVNMSRSYFSQCFKEIVGMNFSDYLRQVRIEKAKVFLLYTNKTILWIAENVGYMDEKYFSRTFREQTDMLPSKYRQTQGTGRDMSDK
ncbi:response regulator [Paenibacillus sp. N3.4]|uniref:response regulator transcription factor n=1 Tax=Paenibacillus sp. N3.4 TaxID=2603222 RepID=UPI0011CA78E3|nr:response regulator [Paenibacillus sp. N3.4]TXK85901.1 response regulator [Paenibacillus sp. N3.4]